MNPVSEIAHNTLLYMHGKYLTFGVICIIDLYNAPVRCRPKPHRRAHGNLPIAFRQMCHCRLMQRQSMSSHNRCEQTKCFIHSTSDMVVAVWALSYLQAYHNILENYMPYTLSYIQSHICYRFGALYDVG